MHFRFGSMFLFLFVFSISIFAQTKMPTGKWSLLGVKADGKDFSIPASTRSPKIRLVDFRGGGALSLQVTCNSASGKYIARQNGKFKYIAGTTTAKHCGDEESEFAVVFHKVFSKAVKYRFKNKVLIFEDAAGDNVLTFTFHCRNCVS